MVEQNKRRHLGWKFREVAKLGKASDNDQSCRNLSFWHYLFKALDWEAGIKIELTINLRGMSNNNRK